MGRGNGDGHSTWREITLHPIQDNQSLRDVRQCGPYKGADILIPGHQAQVGPGGVVKDRM